MRIKCFADTKHGEGHVILGMWEEEYGKVDD
jgi:hypothetical protein